MESERAPGTRLPGTSGGNDAQASTPRGRAPGNRRAAPGATLARRLEAAAPGGGERDLGRGRLADRLVPRARLRGRRSGWESVPRSHERLRRGDARTRGAGGGARGGGAGAAVDARTGRS